MEKITTSFYFSPTSSLIFALFIIILFIEHSGYITILISHYIYIYIYIYICIYVYIHNAKIKNMENKIPDITNLVTNTTLNAKIN